MMTRNLVGSSVRLFAVGLPFRASNGREVVHLIGTRRYCVVGGYGTLGNKSGGFLPCLCQFNAISTSSTKDVLYRRTDIVFRAP